MQAISVIVFLVLFSFVTPSTSTGGEIVTDLFPLVRIYRNGTIERFFGKDIVPPSFDPKTGVNSTDVAIAKGISARLFLPNTTTKATHKLPLLVYYHGGGFLADSGFSSTYHNYVNTLVAAANVIAVSVEYRLAPEHSLPIAYKDSWAALKWVASQFHGNHREEWLQRYADPQRVFFAGDSAGANIAHHMAIKVGTEGGLVGVKLNGIVLVHPYFWGKVPIGSEFTQPIWVRPLVATAWRIAYPMTSGTDDPLFNPAKDPKLKELGCSKVLVCVADQDYLKERGWYYSRVLKTSGWKGDVLTETREGVHVFHLHAPKSQNALAMMKTVASFMNR